MLPAWYGHDLTRAELVRVQRAIGRLARRDLAPTLTEFWRDAALPRAQRMVDSARAGLRGGTAVATDGSGSGLVPVRTIDDLGRWWLGRLRRAAALRALPELALWPVEEIPGRLAHHEMYLLSRPPWSHSDLLLSAFELAHREIADLERPAATPRSGMADTVATTGPVAAGRALTLR